MTSRLRQIDRLQMQLHRGEITETEFSRLVAQLDSRHQSPTPPARSPRTKKRAYTKRMSSPSGNRAHTTAYQRSSTPQSSTSRANTEYPFTRGAGSRSPNISRRSSSPRSSFRSQASQERAASIRGLFTGRKPRAELISRRPTPTGAALNPAKSQLRLSVVVSEPKGPSGNRHKRSMSSDDMSPRIKNNDMPSPIAEEEKSPVPSLMSLKTASKLSLFGRRHRKAESQSSNNHVPRIKAPRHMAPPRPPAGSRRTGSVDTPKFVKTLQEDREDSDSPQATTPNRFPDTLPLAEATRQRQASASVLQSGTTVKRKKNLFGRFVRRSQSEVPVGGVNDSGVVHRVASSRGSIAADGHTVIQGTIAFVPTSREPGWIASKAGMFRIPPGTQIGRQLMVEGQLCSFTCDADSVASNIELASRIPVDYVNTFYDENGHTQWNSPFYVMQSYLTPRGTLTHNEFLKFDRLDVLTDDGYSRLQHVFEEHMNSFINTEGGTIYVGVQKGDNIICGTMMTREEQIEVQDMVKHITTNLWRPAIPDRASKVSLKFVPLCLSDGEICRDFFVIRLSVQGPLYDANGNQIIFSFKRNNLAFSRKLSWNVALSKYNR